MILAPMIAGTGKDSRMNMPWKVSQNRESDIDEQIRSAAADEEDAERRDEDGDDHQDDGGDHD